MTVELSERTLGGLAVSKPQYNRTKLKYGIVHLGVGAFHRAHQAVYTDQLIAAGDERWGIIGASLRSGTVRDMLAPQNFLYTVMMRGAEEQIPRIIGSLLNVLVTTDKNDLQDLVEQIANPASQVVTLTITEKGYCHNQHGELDLTHAEVTNDLADPRSARTAPAIVASGIIRRMDAGAGALTVLSCDNLAGNGGVTRQVVRTFVAHHRPDAVQWLDDNVSFPSSMVDRIVPQTTTEDIRALEQEMGYLDAGLVTCEPFSQWVIEDSFAGTRPDWTIAGAEFVTDVRPFEQAKLRLLNASHSTLAYLGMLAGYEYIHEAMADPTLKQFIVKVMDAEITPAVTIPHGMDLSQYKASILQRFANSAVPYLTRQVASDGSLKLQQRILPTIVDRLRQGDSTPGLCLVIAAWLQCLEGRADDASAITISDPMAEPIAALTARYPQPHARVKAIAQLTGQFGELAEHEEFLRHTSEALALIRKQGALAGAASLLSAPT